MSKSISIFLFLLLSLIMKSFGQNGFTFYSLGYDQKEEGQYEVAIDLFTRGIELDDIYKIANYDARGNCFYELGRYDEAKNDIQSGLETEEINSEKLNTNLYWLKGAISGIEGNKIEELGAYKKALEYSPEDIFLKINYSFVLIELNREEEAIEVLNIVISENEDAFAINNRALAFINQKRYKEAKLDLERSELIDRENPFLYKNYFLYYQAIGHKEEACKSIDLALRKDVLDYGNQEDIEELVKIRKSYCEEN